MLWIQEEEPTKRLVIATALINFKKKALNELGHHNCHSVAYLQRARIAFWVFKFRLYEPVSRLGQYTKPLFQQFLNSRYIIYIP
jgi:hypothetical protein